MTSHVCTVLILFSIFIPIAYSKLDVNTTGCQMANLENFPLEIRQHMKIWKSILCTNNIPLIMSNETAIWINKISRKERNLPPNMQCCYIPFHRKENINNETSFRPFYYKNECFAFNDSAIIDTKFVQAMCIHGQNILYNDFHGFPYLPNLHQFQRRSSKNEKPSVLIIGISSVSRQNLVRQLPQTYKFLRLNKALEFSGLSKIDRGTFPNVLGIITGSREKVFFNTCLNNTILDACTFIWNHFSKKGYVTAFGEDNSLNGIFAQRNTKFIKKPTDFFLEPLMYLNESPGGIGNLKFGQRICSGDRLAADILFNFCTKFAYNMTEENIPFWGMFWSSSLSRGKLTIPRNLDTILRDLFMNLKSANVFEKTVIFFVSDEGVSQGVSYRKSYDGFMEERHPFAFILLPPWLLKKTITSPQIAMIKNQNALVTPYDLGATQMHILNGGYEKPFTFRDGKSLFTNIERMRTCTSAYIPNSYCTCFHRDIISNDNSEVRISASLIIKEINKKIKNKNQLCETVQLSSIDSVFYSKKGFPQIHEYTMIITTEPENITFDATVQYHSKLALARLVSDIHRINPKSNRTCVTDEYVQSLCTCIPATRQ